MLFNTTYDQVMPIFRERETISRRKKRKLEKSVPRIHCGETRGESQTNILNELYELYELYEQVFRDAP